MNISIKALFGMLLLTTALILGGCGPGEEEGPEGAPNGEVEDDEAVPDIPEEIRETEGEEPTLQVFLHEEEQVEEMEFEEYLKGVVAGEMEPDWPKDALAAQAILARTFTLHKISEDGGVPDRDAHASTDIEEFQAYSEEDITEEVEQAVEDTRGEVAVYEDNFIRSWFHAFAGPKTATAEEGLGYDEEDPPYIQVVDSPGMDIVPEEEKNWEESFSHDEISSAVEAVTGESPESIEQVEIVEEGPSGRAMELDIGGVQVPAPELRLELGSEVMRSTFYDEDDIEEGEDEVTFSGVGFGHGVGMCQWGAKALVEENNSPEEVVTYFYENVSIVDLWE
ncbi:SpoIID/LytB domain-containing protein [Natranaerobius thermophilus]|uniref:SpoIID/LytB domain protein n=1 Tax=Natranaerobius thermophilus (strain ATCC BAA-1301 / DSM 18059 / JW/NM-WN-LF) TaxID=457570 RepID=B2A3P4_NATTJ|nr:SpoIID/LytB domain-containing protein [Natranaerobius thermophilus]ACB83670.1 SpoIID/LytB domain protein [Natranaerobius thermophilus JW/NM-WN-LF]